MHPKSTVRLGQGDYIRAGCLAYAGSVRVSTCPGTAYERDAAWSGTAGPADLPAEGVRTRDWSVNFLCCVSVRLRRATLWSLRRGCLVASGVPLQRCPRGTGCKRKYASTGQRALSGDAAYGRAGQKSPSRSTGGGGAGRLSAAGRLLPLQQLQPCLQTVSRCDMRGVASCCRERSDHTMHGPSACTHWPTPQ